MAGRSWRPDFDRAIIRRELTIIHDDLHCNAVHLQGFDLGRLEQAATDALDLGLEVWFSPERWDARAAATLDYVARASVVAETLRKTHGDRIVFSVGTELSLFMRGILPGRTLLRRLRPKTMLPAIRSRRYLPPLRDFLLKAATATRANFRGPITYASLLFEEVDWSLFDFVGADLYRGGPNPDQYVPRIRRLKEFGKPLINLEVGCCTFRGAAELGGRGWQVVDWRARPPRLTGEYAYDQSEQARELGDLLEVNDREGVDGVFVFTFVQPPPEMSRRERQHVARATFDPDLVSYSLVKSYMDGRSGAAYPGLPWEPKQSFRVVADYYLHH